MLNDSKAEKAFYDLYVLDEYMNAENKSAEKKRDKNKANQTDGEETTANNTAIPTNEKEISDSVDAVYNIEYLVAKKGSTYLVKWEDYPEDQNTWDFIKVLHFIYGKDFVN